MGAVDLPFHLSFHLENESSVLFALDFDTLILGDGPLR